MAEFSKPVILTLIPGIAFLMISLLFNCYCQASIVLERIEFVMKK